MNMPATLILIIGLIATALFVGIFIIALIITMRNRKIIQRNSLDKD